MARDLLVEPDGLRSAGDLIAAAPERSATAPSGAVTAPANDPVSSVVSHGISACIGALGTHSALVGAVTGAAARLLGGSADAYADREQVNRALLGAGAPVPAPAVALPRLDTVPTPAPPPIAAPAVGPPPTTGKQIAQLIHGGPGPASLGAAADRLASHAEDLHDSASRIRTAIATMAGAWDSEASRGAEAVLLRLAADHDSHGVHTAAIARAIRTQADYFGQVKRDVPAPEVFEDLERRLHAADAANRANRGLYSGVVAIIQSRLAAAHSQAVTGYAGYAAKSAGNATGSLSLSPHPDPRDDIPVGPDDVIVRGDGSHDPTIQLVDHHLGPLPLDPAPPWPPAPTPSVPLDPEPTPSPPPGSGDPLTDLMLPPAGPPTAHPPTQVDAFYDQIVAQLAARPPDQVSAQDILRYLRDHPAPCSTWEWTKGWGGMGVSALAIAGAAPALLAPGVNIAAVLVEIAALGGFAISAGDVINCTTR